MKIIKQLSLSLITATILCSNMMLSAGNMDMNEGMMNDCKCFEKVIAVVNIQRIMHQSDEVAKIIVQLEEKQKYVNTLIEKGNELIQKVNGLNEQKKILSTDSYNKKLNELQNEIDANQAELNDFGMRAEHAAERVMKKIQRTVTDTLEDYKSERNFSIVLRNDQLLYHEDSLDITTDIIDMFDDRLSREQIDVDQYIKEGSDDNIPDHENSNRDSKQRKYRKDN